MTSRLYGELPGGVATTQGVRRDYAFRPVDGRLELRLAEIVDSADCMPRAVTLALTASLERLAGGVPDAAAIDALCIADRQYLMRELARLLGQEGGWYSAACRRCGCRFDFHLKLADLPIKRAGEGYPHAHVQIGGESLTLRLPSGADQIRLLSLPSAQRQQALLRALVVDGKIEPAWPDSLLPEVVAGIEDALEAVSPALVLEVAASCPDCGEVNAVALNPYEVLFRSAAGLLGEVHRIAWHYHWSEAEILALPRVRREHYLRLIDAARGMVQ